MYYTLESLNNFSTNCDCYSFEEEKTEFNSLRFDIDERVLSLKKSIDFGPKEQRHISANFHDFVDF